jgi:hypothetical protein
MGRLVAVCVLALTTLGWPAATGVASTATLQAVERLEGDFDGDGFIDLAISVPFEDVATARDAGAVSVLYGSAGGLTAAGGQGFWQGSGGAAGTAEAGDQFGSALASGDLNGDGFVDLAIGVPFEDVGSAVDSGALSVLYGSAVGLSPAGGQVFWQGTGGAAGTAETADVFAHALAAGDFDGDGPSDLAIGVAREDVGAGLDAGAVNVLYGSTGGLTSGGGQAFWQGSGGMAGSAEAGDEVGWALAAGDFDGDARADLAAGAPFENVGAVVDPGAVSVLYGSAAGLSPTGSQAFWQGSGGAAGSAERLDLFGFALATGNFGGDGAADLAIGSPLEDIGATADAGAVTALYGSAGGLTSSGSQAFWQGAGGVAGTAEAGDLLGSGFVGGDPSAGPSTAGTVHGRRRANASGLTGDRSSTS